MYNYIKVKIVRYQSSCSPDDLEVLNKEFKIPLYLDLEYKCKKYCINCRGTGTSSDTSQPTL